MQNRVASATLNEVQIQQIAVSIEFRNEPVIVGRAGFPIGIGDEIAFARRMGDKGLGALELADRIGKSRQRPGTQKQNHGDAAERRPKHVRYSRIPYADLQPACQEMKRRPLLPLPWRERAGVRGILAGGRASHSGMLRHPLGGVKAAYQSPSMRFP